MIHFDRQVVVGIALDLSIQHHTDGRRYIDIVKEGLVEFTTKLGLNCGVYVAHPDRHEMPRQQGDSVSGVFSYKEPFPFKATDALRQATEMIAAQDAEEKYVIYITDRYRSAQKNQYDKTLMLNEARKYGCKFLFFGIGNKCEDLKAFEGVSVHQVNDPAQVGQIINEAIIIGV
jgi:hypothetical protein